MKKNNKIKYKSTVSKINKAILFMVILVLVVASTEILGRSICQASTKVVGNGEDIVQKGNKVYYYANHGNYSGRSYQLCSIGTNNRNKKVLDSWKSGYSKRLFVVGNKICYQRNDEVYICPVNKKAPKKIATGNLLCVYGSTIYYTSGKYSNMKLYKIGINKKGKKMLISDCQEISLAGSKGKRLIVNAKVSENSVDIMYVNMSNGKVKKITSEGPNYNFYSYPDVAMDTYIYGNTLYYVCGNYHGSMYKFWGTLKKIGLNGKGKETLEDEVTETNSILNVCGKNLYFTTDSVFKSYNMKDGTLKTISLNYTGMIAGKYIYYSKSDSANGKTVIYRYGLTEGKSKAKEWVTLSKPVYDYSISDICQIGNYVYVDMDMRDNSVSEYGWRGKYMGIETYKMTESGKNIKKIN